MNLIIEFCIVASRFFYRFLMLSKSRFTHTNSNCFISVRFVAELHVSTVHGHHHEPGDDRVQSKHVVRQQNEHL
jgi:hypothetical protein